MSGYGGADPEGSKLRARVLVLLGGDDVPPAGLATRKLCARLPGNAGRADGRGVGGSGSLQRVLWELQEEGLVVVTPWQYRGLRGLLWRLADPMCPPNGNDFQ